MTRDPAREASGLRHRLKASEARYAALVDVLAHQHGPAAGDVLRAAQTPQQVLFAATLLFYTRPGSAGGPEQPQEP